ncbi:MAG: SusD/RagB family nutrient-binding outer membrane lipoprotein [Gemmatimonadaceae bacterium]
MRKGRALILAGALTLLGGCQDFLDVNTNPNAPQTVAANLYLPPMLSSMVLAPLEDGRFNMGRYTQQMIPTFGNNFVRMGYDPPPSGDAGTKQWRDVYFVFGQNLVDMMNVAAAEQRWDILGLGYILKAWGWQVLTDAHGEIIVKEAIDQTKLRFNYDSQEFVYGEVRRLLDSAVVYLERTDGAVDASFMARGDKIYNGNRTKWLRFAHGLRALNLNHYSNKSTYSPAAVIASVDQALQSNADDALFLFPNTTSSDANELGESRALFVSYRQTQFVVGLMNGTQFGGVEDPRMTRMLSPSPDGQYRGLDPNVTGFTGLTTAQQPNNPYGEPGGAAVPPGIYLFDDKVRVPVMTYAQLQFVKAEAAYRSGDRAAALAAYRNALSAHIDFVNARVSEGGQPAGAISTSQKAAFLANPAIVPTAANLTLTHIMSQKYIAQWAWGHNELWMDMRRYRYIDVEPATGRQVFAGFQVPTTLYSANAGKLVYRIRPRYNSEYVWNFEAVKAIGGDALDYHTKPLWIIEP